ncbi:uncharacterized protein [Dendropsophus ebraccatus]|uniref:uncharacterized protein n=1 Tax=Dendropsophus ebraccatus TaxID=150705 RepID=UPI003832068E
MASLAKRQLAAKMIKLAIEMKQQKEQRPAKRKRRLWTKEWLQQRDNLTHMPLLAELTDTQAEDYRNYLRMSEESFLQLLSLVKPFIQKKDTVMRQSIPPEQRLTATLRFLATGKSLQDLRLATAMSQPTLSKVIPETCEAIVLALKDEYFKFPKTAEEWMTVAHGFEEHWQFPNCGGSLDGKHIRISQPPNSGSFFYNYKGYFSVILMALVNANYEFMMVDVGRNGSVSDGGVLELTKFFTMLRDNKLALPSNQETKENLNFVFVGDEAFPLHPHLMKPFPQKNLTPQKKVFNYRLSRARRVVENAFGILANRFRIFHTAINLKPEKIEKVVLACCVLHNYLRRNDSAHYSPPCMLDTDDCTNAEWRQESPALAPLESVTLSRPSDCAIQCRDRYLHYFNNEGAVSWQNAI